jgi:hypothetical protein
MAENNNRSVEVRASDMLVDVRGCLSRTEWELVYLMASKFAQTHGLTITGFELEPANAEAAASKRPATSD